LVPRYERTTEPRGYRNGHRPKRSIGVGMGAVEVSLPRVSDVPKEVSPDGFQSEIVASYQRRSTVEDSGASDGATVSGGAGEW